jgi:hypothetical protein
MAYSSVGRKFSLYQIPALCESYRAVFLQKAALSSVALILYNEPVQN